MPTLWRVVRNLIEERKAQKIIEVGVGGGGMAEFLLSQKETPIKEYIGIDPLIPFGGRGSGSLKSFSHEQWEDKLNRVKKLEMEFHNFTFMRMKSVDASKRFDDGWADLVCIDADHSYESCLADMKAWWRVIKAGGIMMGHDYMNKFKGVIKAYQEFSGKNNPPYKKCWMLIKEE